jgi:predicted lactoylglutathione lyase
MNAMTHEFEARLTLVTLGVSSIPRSVKFYEELGFERRMFASEGIGFFQAGAVVFSVFPSQELARDANLAFENMSDGFRGFSLAWNCRSKIEVDTVIEHAQKTGAVVRKPSQDVFWGGYSGYFTDPDGHLWEVAYNPHFALTDDGRLALPN